MPSPIETLLTNAGLAAEDVTKITTLPEAEQATFDPKPYVDKMKGNYSTQLANDPEFFKSITVDKLPGEVKKRFEGEQFGRAAKIVQEKLLKGLGMTEADYADLPDETKNKIELLIPAIADRYTKTKSGAKEVQEQLIAERKKVEEYERRYGPDYEKEIATKYQTEAEQRITAAMFNAALIGELSSLEGLKVSAQDLAATANALLNSRYAFERVGDFGVELRNKTNPSMKVLKDGSSQELTLREALVQLATEKKWIEDKKPDGKLSGTLKVEPTKNGTLQMVPPHLQAKISNKIAAEK